MKHTYIHLLYGRFAVVMLRIIINANDRAIQVIAGNPTDTKVLWVEYDYY